jgi:hypothetical protein
MSGTAEAAADGAVQADTGADASPDAEAAADVEAPAVPLDPAEARRAAELAELREIEAEENAAAMRKAASCQRLMPAVTQLTPRPRPRVRQMTQQASHSAVAVVRQKRCRHAVRQPRAATGRAAVNLAR